jgi:hypothetical protein
MAKKTNQVDVVDMAKVDALANIAAMQAQLKEQAKQIAQLKLRLARGTGDITERAEAAVAAVKPVTLEDNLQRALQERPRTFDDLSKHVDAEPAKVSNALHALRKAKKIVNVGSEELPRWFWVVGDDAPVEVIYAAVGALIRDRPFTLQELLAVTSARASRVSGAIRNLMSEGNARVMNIGTPGRARWFVVPEISVHKRPRGTAVNGNKSTEATED